MCMFSQPSIPAPPPPPPPPPEPAKEIDPAVQAARADARKKARLAGGYSSTILTDLGSGPQRSDTAGKTLLGA